MSTDARTRPMRSWLFTPATRPERFGKAREVGADVLILDLEDAVAPADKSSARITAMEHATVGREGGPLLAVRVNGLATRAGLADLSALLDGRADPDFAVLPKVESAGDLRTVDRLLGAANKRARLVALIESAPALARLEEIAAATPRLAALLFGAADMAADLGAETAWEPLLGARQRLVAAAAAAGVLAVDTPFFDVRDAEGLAAETRRGVALGFAAKAAIHPAQVGPINAALTPSDEAVANARKVLEENGKGVGTVGGLMIDEAVARKARRTLAVAGETA
ncbi:CoA ester lyase [Lichenibacterium minor]|uniref:CoA ester lyase n=1 Tax=Lichenibacterium minor TaxID=2316528 RepID=A0A4Q2TZD5_9HYPH|nr:itaconate degradation C-C-lyase RipC [Lichenibacterium minor]RYC29120.1 CoA ester lyase [Lichenibacterium minor]